MEREGRDEIRSRSQPIWSAITSMSAIRCPGGLDTFAKRLTHRGTTLQTKPLLNAANHQPSSRRDIQLLPTFM